MQTRLVVSMNERQGVTTAEYFLTEPSGERRRVTAWPVPTGEIVPALVRRRTSTVELKDGEVLTIGGASLDRNPSTAYPTNNRVILIRPVIES